MIPDDPQNDRVLPDNMVVSEKRVPIYLIAAILLWALTIFLAQSQYIVVSYWQEHMEIKIAIRLVLDFLCAAAILCFLPRWAAVIVIVFTFFGSIGLITSSYYFERNLSVISLLANFDEGVAVTDAIFALLPLKLGVILFLINAIIIVLLYKADKTVWPPKRAWRYGCLFACFYFVTLFGLDRIPQISFTHLNAWKGTGDVAVTWGIIPTWAGEWFAKNNSTLIEVGLNQPRTNRLTPNEIALKLPRQVVVVQVESLDYAIIGREINGKIVTPFFNKLKNESLFYKVDSFHNNGSADADYAFLNTREPSPNILNYKIEGFPYQDTLPECFCANQYQAYFFHNATGKFFSRLHAIQQMGFTKFYFVEEIVDTFHVQPQKGTSFLGAPFVSDDQLLQVVAQNVNANKEKSLFFAITLMTHVPYNLVQERTIFEYPANLFERYVNSIHYVDRAMEGLYNSLPNGTMLIVYGDHSTSIREGDYVAREHGGKDYVPCMISIVGDSIADQQKTNPDFAIGGELSLVDISSYLRSLLEK